jgi:AbrB family looped-hinge helix DNA binding protein
MPRRKASYDLTRQVPQSKVNEAAAEYFIGAPGEDAMTTISSKNQITLPAHLLREMGLAAGDRLAVALEGGRLVLRARPKDWVQYYGGSLAGLYGDSAAEIEAYIAEERSHTERDEAIEGAWAGSESAPQR